MFESCVKNEDYKTRVGRMKLGALFESCVKNEDYKTLLICGDEHLCLRAV